MAKPDRTCFGMAAGHLHIGLCCDFWADDGMCVCNPVDAAEYPQAQRLYIAGNISGFSSPNIRTIFPDGHDHVRTFDRGDYCWAYWDWGDIFGTVKFELRDGSTVRVSRSTRIVGASAAGVDYKCMDSSWDTIQCTSAMTSGVELQRMSMQNWAIVGEKTKITYRFWNPTENTIITFTPLLVVGGSEIRLPNVNAAARSSTLDVYEHVFTIPGTYSVSLKPNPGNLAPVMVTVYERECAEGEKKDRFVCPEGDIIFKEVCKRGKWVPTGEICPEKFDWRFERSHDACYSFSSTGPSQVTFRYTYSTRTALGGGVPVNAVVRRPLYIPSEAHKATIAFTMAVSSSKWARRMNIYVAGELVKSVARGSYTEKVEIDVSKHRGSYIDLEIRHTESTGATDHNWRIVLSNVRVDVSPDPCEGVTCDPECVGTDLYDSTCVDGVCVRGELIEADSVRCGFKICAEGEKRNPKTCWDGSTIHEQVCRNNAWVPSGETCPPKPECTEGDKKPGHVCVDGKWKEVTVAEPGVPPVEPPAAPPEYLTPAEADERIQAGLPCYIKCTLPLLDLLPGIPYTPGMWVPPFCAITTKP